MIKKLIKILFFTQVFLAGYIVASILFPTKIVFAQVPKPYVDCSQVKDDEWNSLRPYQSSPCNIPLKPDEQSVLCGNDLIVNDKIYIGGSGECPGGVFHKTGDKHECLNCCPPPGGCSGTVDRDFVAQDRDFLISFDAYNSELPIAGNTELVKGDNAPPSILTGTKSIRLSDFLNKEPPERSDYDNFHDYYVDYQTWRGKVCHEFELPIIKKVIFFCWDSPGNPNYIANLFPKIPYSSTEDRVGKARVDRMLWYPNKSTVIRINPDPPDTIWNPKNPVYGKDPNIETLNNQYAEVAMYFPHMEENIELSSLLQSTYLPYDLLRENQTIGDVEPVPPPDPECHIVDVRYNPGDQLFGERDGTLGVPNAHVKYEAYFKCPVTYKLVCDPWGYCTCTFSYNCERNSWFQSDVSTYTPMIDELFAKTVAGGQSIVKKIFPQIGTDTPIEKIKDIPASTDVEHHTQPVKNTHPELISDPAEFYIPHFGSIYDYFLEDMQTALRPKGYPGRPAGLNKSAVIPEGALVNEYLSWYLNGTLYRAEQGTLDARNSWLQNLLNIPPDSDRIVNLTGPLNKLLSQSSQWRNQFATSTLSTGTTSMQQIGKVDDTQRAKVNRHDQIIGCITNITIPIFIPIIGGWHIQLPIPCRTESQKNLPSGGGGTNPPPSGTCPQVPDSAIPKAMLDRKANFIDLANRLGSGNNLAEECYNYVVKESISKNVNAGFSLAIWLHESYASDQQFSDVLDFGMQNAAPNNVVDQLEKFLLLPFGSFARDCAYDTSQNWATPMHGFLCVYAYGLGCNSQNPLCSGTDPDAYYNLLHTYFNWVTGCATLPTYPTDKTCPVY